MSLERPVKQEYTGLRDLGLSSRHRQWGFDAPAVDIDFLMIEYDHDAPKALIEYKAYQGHKINIETSAIRALANLANASGLPFFVVAYHPKEFWVYIKPINKRAMAYLKDAGHLSEADFVRLLYRLRGKVCPLPVIRRCNTQKRG